MTYSLQNSTPCSEGIGATPHERLRADPRRNPCLSYDPRPRNCHKLIGREGWRIRVGHYRVIYEIDDRRQVVTVVHVGHRRDVYR